MKLSNFFKGAFSGGVLTAFGFLFISAGYETSMKKTCIETTELTSTQRSKLATKSVFPTYINFIVIGSVVGGIGYSVKEA